MRVGIVLLSLCACGRIAFDTLGDGRQADPDGASASGDAGPSVLGTYGGTGADWGRAIARRPDGGAVVVGQLTSAINLGGIQLSPVGEADVLVYSVDATGHIEWAKTFGTSGVDTASAVAVDDLGSIYVAGLTFGPIDFSCSGGPLNNAFDDVFLVSLTPSGACRWARRIGGEQPTGPYNNDVGLGVAIAAGRVVVTGHVTGSMDFGGGTTSSNGAALDIFAAAYDTQLGNYSWARRFGDTGLNIAYAVATDGTNVYLGGEYEGTPSFGAGPVTQRGVHDAVVLALSLADGSYQWAQTWGGPGFDWVFGLAVDASHVYASAFFETSNDLGMTSNGGRDGMVAALSPSLGGVQWSHQLGSTGCDQARAVRLTNDGIVVAGEMGGTIDFGDGPRTPSGGSDGFAVRYTPSGAFQSVYTSGDPMDDANWDIAEVGPQFMMTGHRTSTAQPECGQYDYTSERAFFLRLW